MYKSMGMNVDGGKEQLECGIECKEVTTITSLQIWILMDNGWTCLQLPAGSTALCGTALVKRHRAQHSAVLQLSLFEIRLLTKHQVHETFARTRVSVEPATDGWKS